MFKSLMNKGGKRPKAQKAEPRSRADGNAVLRKTVGARFVAAREINGWGQSEAALLLGYRNSTQLSLIEKGVRLPPYGILVSASGAYSVSIDFLVGVSDEPERDPKLAERQAAMRHVEGVLKRQAESVTGLILQYLNHGAPSVMTSRTLLARAVTAVDSLRRFHEINRDRFDDLRGGAPVLAAVEQLTQAVNEARAMIERHERLMENAFKTAELKADITRPLFDAPAYRQGQLGIVG